MLRRIKTDDPKRARNSYDIAPNPHGGASNTIIDELGVTNGHISCHKEVRQGLTQKMFFPKEFIR